MRVNTQGYLERRTYTCANPNTKCTYREWWIVKTYGYGGLVPLTNLNLPKKYIGKKVRFKMEIIEDGE